ncbi:flagellin [Tepidanaerobacter acetatoxydans]|uniref:flagellin n=1 Tax=Tepidanaerobacter acetatoxydans TaxID=499229 RepID=UPI001BD207FD|nr:flagellin [Tepidanaerobacter acetatoxydans]
MLKRIKELLANKKGEAIIGFVIVLIFIILVAAPHVKNLGKTTSNGVSNLNDQMEDTLNE